MECVVKSDVFTDEQKVVIVEALSKRDIVINFEPTFEKINHSYFIKNDKKYVYVMQFCDGLKYFKINSEYYQLHAIFTEYVMSKNTICFLDIDDIFYYDMVNLFPYARYNKISNRATVIKQSLNANIFKHLLSKYGFRDYVVKLVELDSEKNLQLSQPIENLNHLSINSNNYTFTYNNNQCDIINFLKEQNLETKKQKDGYWERVEKLPNGEDYKNKIYTERLNKAKEYIVGEIERSIESKYSLAHFQFDKIHKSIQSEAVKFIKDICKEKDYIFGTSENGFYINLYLP